MRQDLICKRCRDNYFFRNNVLRKDIFAFQINIQTKLIYNTD